MLVKRERERGKNTLQSDLGNGECGMEKFPNECSQCSTAFALHLLYGSWRKDILLEWQCRPTLH